MTTDVNRLKAKLTAGKVPEPPLDFASGLSTGSTLLNLALTDRPGVGFLPGKYFFLVGDSSSGKSFLSLTCFAEAAQNPKYEKYRLIYDNAEDGALMDFRRYFGKRMADRVEPPGGDRAEPVYSTSVEEFYYHLDDACEEGTPFLYVLDSMDSLSSDPEAKKFKEQKSAARNGKESSGSYGDGKAKENSSRLRQVLHKLKATGSILVVIAQTRDNIGFGSLFDPKTRSGGHALRFYATAELWSSIRERVKRSVGEEKLQVGIVCKIQVKKNRITGKERSVEFPIYYDAGIDDTGGLVRYLIKTGKWKKNKKGVVLATDFDLGLTEERLVRKIEADGSEKELRLLAADAWREVEAGCAVVRKSRYS